MNPLSQLIILIWKPLGNVAGVLLENPNDMLRNYISHKSCDLRGNPGFKLHIYFNKLRLEAVKQKVMRKLQNVFWIYLTSNFIITNINDYKKIEPECAYGFIPITLDNYLRVGDFRQAERISEYGDKLAHHEIGFFAEHNGRMIGSIWATINKAEASRVVRKHMRLMPNEGLIHDIVTGEKFRGMGVGPFMVRKIASIVLQQYGLSKIIIDVNIKNRASLRMMDKAGLRIDYTMFCVSAFGKLIFQMVFFNKKT